MDVEVYEENVKVVISYHLVESLTHVLNSEAWPTKKLIDILEHCMHKGLQEVIAKQQSLMVVNQEVPLAVVSDLA